MIEISLYWQFLFEAAAPLDRVHREQTADRVIYEVQRIQETIHCVSYFLTLLHTLANSKNAQML